MSRPTLLLTRRLPAAVETRARSHYDVRQDERGHLLSPDDLVTAANGMDAILCAPGDRLDAGVIARLPACVRAIATFSVGTDHIDLAAAGARGILVGNTPDVLSIATAEVTMLLMLMAARRAGEGERIVRASRWTGWEPTQLVGIELSGLRLGIYGMGRIGREVGRMARAFSMPVHYHNRNRLPPDMEGDAVYHERPEDLLAVSDVLSLNAPATPASRGWLSAARIALLPQGAIVVNTARGALINDDDLIAALTSGRIAAAGLDVFNDEPRIHAGYLRLDNVALLPHLGSATAKARNAMGALALDFLDRVMAAGPAAADSHLAAAARS